MSRKRPTNAGWESDEEDLLMTDGGISAFKTEDDEIDEEALLGIDDDDGNTTSFLQTDHSRVDFQDSVGQEQGELLEIGVDEEEIEELAVEEEDNTGIHAVTTTTTSLLEEEEVEQLDYNDDLSQTDLHDIQLEYEDTAGEVSVSEADVSQDDPVVTETQTSFTESTQVVAATEKTGDSESESEDSDGEKQGRGRFKSERPNIVSISKAKSRTDIPDTLEVSAEQQAQIDQFPDRRHRDRGRGRGSQRGGMQCAFGNSQGRTDQRSGGGGPIRTQRGRPLQQLSNLGQLRPFGQDLGRPRPYASAQPRPFGPDMGQRRPFRPDVSIRPGLPQPGILQQRAVFGQRAPQPLMGLGLSQGSRMVGPNQGSPMVGPNQASHVVGPNQASRMMGPNQSSQIVGPSQGNHIVGPNQGNRMIGPNQGNRMVGPNQVSRMVVPSQANRMPGQTGNRDMLSAQQRGMALLVPGQHRGMAPSVPGQHRGMAPSVPGQMVSHPPNSMPGSLGPTHQPPPQSQPYRPVSLAVGSAPRPHTIHINPNFRGPAASSAPSSAIPAVGHGQPTLSQPAPSLGGERLNRPVMPSQLQPFASHQGMGQPGVTGSPSRLPGPSPPGFAGQQSQQHQPQFPIYSNSQQQQQAAVSPAQGGSAFPSPRFSPQGNPGFRRQAPQQQLQQQRPRLSAAQAQPQRRVGMQQRPVTTAAQSKNTVTMARKLSQQARLTQQARAATQSVNKNITVVPLKRHSTGNDDDHISPKVARTAQPSAAEEPGDDELQRGLEEQKRLREMIRKRKEEARRRQANLRRKELESRLAEQGLKLEDIEGEGDNVDKVLQPEQPRPAVEVPQGGQRIRTLVSSGGKKQLGARRQSQQRHNLQQQQQQQQQPPSSQHTDHSQQFSVPFSSPPPNQHHHHHQHQQQQQQYNVGLSQGFSQQQQQQQQGQGQGVGRMLAGNRQQHISPVAAPAASPVKGRPFHPTPQTGAMQSPTPPRPLTPGASAATPRMGGQFAGRQQQQQPVMPAHPQYSLQPPLPQPHQVDTPRAFVAPRGRGAPRGMARGEVTGGRGQGKGHMTGQGQMGGVGVRGQEGRGRGQMSRGRGHVGRGAGPVPTSPASGPPSHRTVLPVGQGRAGLGQGHAGVGQGRGGVGGAMAPGAAWKSGAAAGGAMAARQVMAPGAAGGGQKVSIDNLAMGTSEFSIRQCCEAVGPVSNLVLIESQRKAIVTFSTKVHAALFAKQWNRRMMNMSVVSVNLLP